MIEKDQASELPKAVSEEVHQAARQCLKPLLGHNPKGAPILSADDHALMMEAVDAFLDNGNQVPSLQRRLHANWPRYHVSYTFYRLWMATGCDRLACVRFIMAVFDNFDEYEEKVLYSSFSRKPKSYDYDISCRELSTK